ncbi:MAG: hypothetical protein HUJ25_00085 [Crocinitomicaceae bacterium]|nr:hypothetical protein [Crocinitomicaceae bacterium]
MTEEEANEMFLQYKSLTRSIYDRMSPQKRQQWVDEFIFDSYQGIERSLIDNNYDAESQFILRKKLEKLGNVGFALQNFNENTFKPIGKEKYEYVLALACVNCQEIIEQTLDLIFNHDLAPEEKKTQLEGVLPNYYFALFQLKEVEHEVRSLPSSFWN